MIYQDIINELTILASPIKARISSGFFKTGPGQYGEGDKFLGITVPVTRKIVKEYTDKTTLSDIEQLLCSPFHEIRLSGVLLLVEKYKKAERGEQENIYIFYMDHLRYINNWDLVDLSAPNIVGTHLFDKNRGILGDLAHSPNLWERRIAIIATFSFIRKGDYSTTFSIIEMLLDDKHDLIHKANGWMLREVGKRCGQSILESFLEKNYSRIARTTLRYAIERFETDRKKYWMEYGQK